MTGPDGEESPSGLVPADEEQKTVEQNQNLGVELGYWR
jgi:hypothetical protein